MSDNPNSENNSSFVGKMLDVMGPLIALAFVFILFAVLDYAFGSQQFLSINNYRTILIQTAVVAVAALGMTLIIISGGIDLSAGTALALCATVLAWGLNEDVGFLISQGTNFESSSRDLEKTQKTFRKLNATKGEDAPDTLQAKQQYEADKAELLALLEIKIAQVENASGSEEAKAHLEILQSKRSKLTDPNHIFTASIDWLKKIPNSPWSIWLALSMALLTGILTGTINGLLITSLRVVPFIITLGTMTIYSGFGLYLANDTPILPNVEMQVPSQLSMLISNSKDALLFGLPMGIWLLVLMSIIMALLIRYSVLSRHLFAIGSNEATARLCGINVPKTKVLIYAISGLSVGIAGIYLFSRLASGNPTGGAGKELEIIAAVVIGGGSLNGGRGSILGTIAGALLVGVISAGSTLLEWRLSMYYMILGCVIIGAVLVDQIRQRYHESN